MPNDNRPTDSVSDRLMRALTPIVLRELVTSSPALDTPHGKALTDAVYRAIDDLEGQGTRSQRIAGQLLMALGRYEFELEQSQITPVIFPVVEPARYRIEFCTWVDGFDAEQQDWKASEHEYDDEYEANTMRERCDEKFRRINIRHRVVTVKL